MRRSTGDRDVIAVAGLQVGGGLEAREVGSAGSSHCSVFVRAARAHLNDGAAVRGNHHAGSRRSHRGIGIHDGKDHGFQDEALAEGAAHGQQRRVREVQLAFPVAIDLPGEAVIGQVLLGLSIKKVHLRQLLSSETEVPDGAKNALGAGNNAVAPLVGEAAGKNFAGYLAVRGAIAQRRLQHGQLVLIGKKGRGAIRRDVSGIQDVI